MKITRTEKTCVTCKVIKPIDQFTKKTSSADGRMSSCKVCQDVYCREWRKRNKDRCNATSKRWCQENPAKRKEVARKCRIKHLDKCNAATKRWREENEEYYNRIRREWQARNYVPGSQLHLSMTLRNRLQSALTHEYKSGSAVSDLGTSIESFKSHLESLWSDGMDWKNYGKKKGQWNIDHIMPLTKFDLSDRQHVLLACNYLNLRPMWQDENVRKSNKCPIEMAA